MLPSAPASENLIVCRCGYRSLVLGLENVSWHPNNWVYDGVFVRLFSISALDDKRKNEGWFRTASAWLEDNKPL